MARKLPARRDVALPDLTKALGVIQAHVSSGGTDEIEVGFYSAEQIAKAWRKSTRQTRTLLIHARGNGLAEYRTFRVNGREVGHYRLPYEGV